MNSSRGAADSLPQPFVAALRNILERFDVLPHSSGCIHIKQLAENWHVISTWMPRGTPFGLLDCFRRVAPPNGMLTMERLVAGFRLALSEQKQSVQLREIQRKQMQLGSSSDRQKLVSTGDLTNDNVKLVSSSTCNGDAIADKLRRCQQYPPLTSQQQKQKEEFRTSASTSHHQRPPEKAARIGIPPSRAGHMTTTTNQNGVSLNQFQVQPMAKATRIAQPPPPPRPPEKTSRGIEVARQLQTKQQQPPLHLRNYENYEKLEEKMSQHSLESNDFSGEREIIGMPEQTPRSDLSTLLLTWKDNQLAENIRSSPNRFSCSSVSVLGPRNSMTQQSLSITPTHSLNSFIDSSNQQPHFSRNSYRGSMQSVRSQPNLFSSTANYVNSSQLLPQPSSAQQFSSGLTVVSSGAYAPSGSSASPPQDPVPRLTSRSLSGDLLNRIANGHYYGQQMNSSRNGSVELGYPSSYVPPVVKLRQKVANNNYPVHSNADLRRHTLSELPDTGLWKHKRALVDEKELLQKGQGAATRLSNWYHERLKTLETREKFVSGGTMFPLDFAVHEEKLNYLRAHVTEINRRIVELMESSEKSFPSQINAEYCRSIPQPAEDEIRWLKKQNNLLSNEVASLEQEKETLHHELQICRKLTPCEAGINKFAAKHPEATLM